MDAEKKGSFVPKTITDGSPFAKGWSLVRWQHCNVTCAHKGTEPMMSYMHMVLFTFSRQCSQHCLIHCYFIFICQIC